MATRLTPMRLTDPDLENAQAIIATGASDNVTAAARLALEYVADAIRAGSPLVFKHGHIGARRRFTPYPDPEPAPRARARAGSAARSTR